ncbi:MAG: hypothetical protein RDV48_03300 [Candidatus Eremiobacteraeota bacterium]|nr:hypothetical protein [Candidatus Eremiobacteraeota bacterium]
MEEHSEQGVPGEPGIEPSLPSGNDPADLERFKGWNWGACAFTGIWQIAFGMQAWGIIVLVSTLFLCFPGVIASLYLGAKGNELAWRYHSFASFDEYREAMRVWNYWGIVFIICNCVVALVLTAVLVYLGVKIFAPFLRELNF